MKSKRKKENHIQVANWIVYLNLNFYHWKLKEIFAQSNFLGKSRTSCFSASDNRNGLNKSTGFAEFLLLHEKTANWVDFSSFVTWKKARVENCSN